MASTDRETHGLIIEGGKRASFSQSEDPTFDTLGLWIPRSAIVAEAPEEPQPGIEGVRIHETGARFVISSRVLRERYGEMLSRRTIRCALELMNERGPLMVDPDRVLAEGMVFRADRTVDLRPERAPSAYMRGLRLACPEKWVVGRDGHHGLWLRNTARGFVERLTLYDKGKQLRSKPIPGIDPDLFAGVLRVEYRITRAKQIRARFKIADARLVTLLSAKRNPAIEFLTKWRSRFSPVPARGGIRGERDRRFAISVLEEHDYDPARIEVWIKLCGGRPSDWLPRIMAYASGESRLLLDEVLEAMSSG